MAVAAGAVLVETRSGRGRAVDPATWQLRIGGELPPVLPARWAERAGGRQRPPARGPLLVAGPFAWSMTHRAGWTGSSPPMSERAAAPTRVSLVQALLGELPLAALGRSYLPNPPKLLFGRLEPPVATELSILDVIPRRLSRRFLQALFEVGDTSRELRALTLERGLERVGPRLGLRQTLFELLALGGVLSTQLLVPAQRRPEGPSPPAISLARGCGGRRRRGQAGPAEARHRQRPRQPRNRRQGQPEVVISMLGGITGGSSPISRTHELDSVSPSSSRAPRFPGLKPSRGYRSATG
jgi:hypothetical protein